MSYNISSNSSINAQDCCFNLRKVTRAVTQFYDRYLEPAGIRATQFTLLLTLTSASGKTLTEMAKELVMDRTTLTRNLKPLEKAGLIVTKKLSDRRTKGYGLTEKGQHTITLAKPKWEAAQQKIVGQFGQTRYDGLLKELTAVQHLANLPKPTRIRPGGYTPKNG